jgi:hypothetical protein
MFLVLSLSVGTQVRAQEQAISKEYAQDIRKLLVLAGSDKLSLTILDTLEQSFLQIAPDIPDAFWQEMREDINAGEIIELVIPVYAKYLTHEEIQQLIVFYESPVGRKLAVVQPRIFQESYLLGQEWGQAIGEKMQRELIDRGYLKL